MNRRRFSGLAASASLGLIPNFRQGGTLACSIEFTPDPTLEEYDPVDSAATLFRWPDGNDLRSVAIRIRQWSDPRYAKETQIDLMNDAGSDVPESENYVSDKVVLDVPDRDERDTMALVAWTTTAGVAAYQTGHVLLSIWRGTLLWDAAIAASDLDTASGFAQELISILLDDLPDCSTIAGFLPELEDMPPDAMEEPYT